jgi:hypothetical protein
MRVPKSWVRPIAERIVKSMVEEGLATPAVPLEKLIGDAEAALLEELMVEDRLNDEVREMLKKYEGEIQKGHLDYRKLFDLTKHKLVKERNLVL